MGRSHDGLGSPQETPHFPQCLRAFLEEMKKVALFCCREPSVGFRVSPSTAIKPKKNGTNKMNNTAKVIKSSTNHNYGIGSVGLVISKGIKFSVVMIGGNQWKIKNSNLKFN
jgi:hypothetical protein